MAAVRHGDGGRLAQSQVGFKQCLSSQQTFKSPVSWAWSALGPDDELWPLVCLHDGFVNSVFNEFATKQPRNQQVLVELHESFCLLLLISGFSEEAPTSVERLGRKPAHV